MGNEKSVIDMERYLDFALLDDDTYAVKSFKPYTIEKDKLESLVIPSTYNGKPVTVIGNEAFGSRTTSVESFRDNCASEGYLGRIKDEDGFILYEDDLIKLKKDNKPVNGSAFINNLYVGPVSDGTVNILALGHQYWRKDSVGREYKATVCGSVKSIVIPDSVTTIGESAFCGCNEIANITIGKNVKIIGISAFVCCDKLTEIVIPDSVTDISNGSGTFRFCKGLESVVLGNSIKELKESDFCWSGLKNLKIGKGTTEIEIDVFHNVINYDINLTIDSDNPSYKVMDNGIYTRDGKKLIRAKSKESTYIITEGVIDVGEDALSRKKALKELLIPSSVKRLERCILFGCDNCSTIYYKGTKADWKKIHIDEDNIALNKATVYFYSETPSGNSWRYGSDGVTPEITHTSIFSKLVKIFKK